MKASYFPSIITKITPPRPFPTSFTTTHFFKLNHSNFQNPKKHIFRPSSTNPFITSSFLSISSSFNAFIKSTANGTYMGWNKAPEIMIRGVIFYSGSADPLNPKVWATSFAVAILKKLNSSKNGSENCATESKPQKAEPEMIEAVVLASLEKLFKNLLNMPEVERKFRAVVMLMLDYRSSKTYSRHLKSIARILQASQGTNLPQEEKVIIKPRPRRAVTKRKKK